jgi:hypothetical protein
MSKKSVMRALGFALAVISAMSTANAMQFRGGARASVSGGDMASRQAGRQSSHEANVTTRQQNATERQSNRQNTMSNASNNRANVANNVSNNRTNVANNYNHNGGCCNNNGWDNDHPVATAAAVTAVAVTTAAVVGSIVHSIPPSCSAVMVNGLTYQQCGSTWYQPQYAGTTVQYVVINAPR